jgi:isopentenyldiphosphate isomerase
MAKVIIVNKNDEIIGYKERDMLEPSDIYRVSALWIQNSKGDTLLAQRSLKKKNDPGKWGPAVAGTNEKGETYESNIIKEAEEEIGLSGHSFQEATKPERFSGHFGQLFFVVVDKHASEFKIQESEVEQIKWFSRNELLEELKQNPEKFVKAVARCVDLFNK